MQYQRVWKRLINNLPLLSENFRVQSWMNIQIGLKNKLYLHITEASKEFLVSSMQTCFEEYVWLMTQLSQELRSMKLQFPFETEYFRQDLLIFHRKQNSIHHKLPPW